MAETILFIFEGEKTEAQIYKKLYQHYFSSCRNTKIVSTYNTNIYKLWAELAKDEFLDIVELIRERSPENEKKLLDIDREQIAQVYLFFDHDGHDPDSSNIIIESMLELYDEETENGKLFLSYPMVESLRDFSGENTFTDLTAIIPENKDYKKIVAKRTIYKDLRRVTKKDWDFIISAHLKKGHYIVNNEYSFVSYDNIRKINQMNIFHGQKSKYIQKTNSVSILNGFPFFIVDYFGFEQYNFFKDNEDKKYLSHPDKK